MSRAMGSEPWRSALVTSSWATRTAVSSAGVSRAHPSSWRTYRRSSARETAVSRSTCRRTLPPVVVTPNLYPDPSLGTRGCAIVTLRNQGGPGSVAGHDRARRSGGQGAAGLRPAARGDRAAEPRGAHLVRAGQAELRDAVGARPSRSALRPLVVRGAAGRAGRARHGRARALLPPALRRRSWVARRAVRRRCRLGGDRHHLRGRLPRRRPQAPRGPARRGAGTQRGPAAHGGRGPRG